MGLAFFRIDGAAAGDEVLVPQPVAGSGWSTNQMRGIAVSGALSRATERAVLRHGRDELRPVRWTVDLFRAATMDPCVANTRFVREGRRLCLVDSTLEQDGRAVARASALYLAPGDAPPGEVWRSSPILQPPPLDLRPTSNEPRLYFSEGRGWSDAPGEHQGDGRKQTWHFALPIVHGEEPSPFQIAASVADVTNVVANLGSAGLAFINADITVHLARLPVSNELGLSAMDRVEQDGIAVGTALMFDRSGVLGTSVVSTLANSRRAVDLAQHGFGAEPPPPRSGGLPA